jgi:hypothetical protein
MIGLMRIITLIHQKIILKVQTLVITAFCAGGVGVENVNAAELFVVVMVLTVETVLAFALLFKFSNVYDVVIFRKCGLLAAFSFF